MCTFRDKYFNAVDVSCDAWETCNPLFSDLDTSTNICVEKTPTKEICDAKAKYFNEATVACDDWIVCQTG